jgi:hypothetical protein
MAKVENAVDAEIVDEAIADDARVGSVIDVRDTVAGLNKPDSGFYSTIKADGFAARLQLGKAINDSKPLDTVLGDTFQLANYIVQVVEIADGQTGELVLATRVTLLDDSGNAYHGTSKGLLTAIRNLNATVGDPSQWEGNTIAVKVVMEGVRPRQYFTIKYI